MLGYYAPVLTSEQTRTLANARQQNATDGLVEPPHVLNAPQPPAEVPPAPLDHLDRAELLQTALRARRAYPGPVGHELAELLTAWSDFGFRLGGYGRIAKLVAAVESVPLPEPLPDAA